MSHVGFVFLKMSSKKLTLSDKFAKLINPAPFQDPEDDFIQEETTAQVVDNFDEESDDEAGAGVSSLRRQNAEVLGLVDGRYAGEKISRRELKNSSEEDSDEAEVDASSQQSDESDGSAAVSDVDQEEEQENESVDYDSAAEGEEGESAEASSGEEDEEEEDEDGAMFAEEGKEENEGEEGSTSFQHFSSSDRGTEVEKGNAVRNQLNIWDGILEFRIQLQKCVLSSNQLPLSDKFGKFKAEGSKDFASAQALCTNKVSNLLEKLTQLQTEFLKKNPETKNILSKNKATKAAKGSDDEEIVSSSEEEQEESEGEGDSSEQQPRKKRKLEDFSTELATSRAQFLGFRDTTIQKWNDKTRVAQGRVSSKNFSAFEQSTLKQIEQVLADKSRLLKRTRMKRSGYRILGQPEKTIEEKDAAEAADDGASHEYCAEIFDDDDFYHQLLRELIEHKSEGVTDPVQLGRQWIALQKLRSKMKRKIDTRATKGRKIRYAVHPKLVSFMAPYDKGAWTEESKTELFTSLFAT